MCDPFSFLGDPFSFLGDPFSFSGDVFSFLGGQAPCWEVVSVNGVLDYYTQGIRTTVIGLITSPFGEQRVKTDIGGEQVPTVMLREAIVVVCFCYVFGGIPMPAGSLLIRRASSLPGGLACHMACHIWPATRMHPPYQEGKHHYNDIVAIEMPQFNRTMREIFGEETHLPCWILGIRDENEVASHIHTSLNIEPLRPPLKEALL